MVGALLSLFVAIGYIQLAWTGGDYAFFTLETLWVALGLVLVGVFLFPRTIGTLLVPALFISPVASVIALIRHGWGHAAVVAGIGLIAFVVTLVIATFRPDSHERGQRFLRRQMLGDEE